MTVGRVDWAGYVRRVADFEYRAKLGKVPADMALLLELTREIEFSDKVILDSKDVGE